MVKINPKAEKLYPVICKWCGKTISWKNVENSHTICPSCAYKMLAEMRASLTG